MFTELSSPSTPRRTEAPPSTRRPGTVALELQAAYKFGLALALGVAGIWAGLPHAGAAAIVIVAVVLAARSLAVLAHDPTHARTIRPAEHAAWDGMLAAALALIAIALVISGDGVGVAVAGVGAVLLAALRLRTRYVAG